MKIYDIDNLSQKELIERISNCKNNIQAIIDVNHGDLRSKGVKAVENYIKELESRLR